MQAPSADELLKEVKLLAALEEAWNDSVANDPQRRHEEGGWIYFNATSGDLEIRRATPGSKAAIDLNDPPVVAGAVVVATFHTHPNPSAEGWNPGPSPGDTRSAWILGVPCIIRAEDGIHTTGPERRRGGLSSGPGFPM
jgi:hypothetical protein